MRPWPLRVEASRILRYPLIETYIKLDLVPGLSDGLIFFIRAIFVDVVRFDRLLQRFGDVIQGLAVADDGSDDHDDEHDLQFSGHGLKARSDYSKSVAITKWGKFRKLPIF